MHVGAEAILRQHGSPSAWAGAAAGGGGGAVGARTASLRRQQAEKLAQQQREEQEYIEQHGVRRPDPVRQQRLVDDAALPGVFSAGGMGIAARSSRGRLDPSSVTWMFAPPIHLSHDGEFEEVRSFCAASSCVS